LTNPGVRGHVVDPVRDRVPGFPVSEAVVADLHRVAPGPPFPAACAYWPTCSFFLASTLITGCPAARCSVAWPAMSGTGRPGPDAAGPRRPWHWPAWRTPLPAAAARRSAAAPCPCARSSSDRCLRALGRPQQRRLRIPPAGILHQASSAGRSPGSTSASGLRPAPGAAPGLPARPARIPAPPPRSRPSATTPRSSWPPPRSRRPRRPGHRPRVSRRAFSSSSGSRSPSSGPIAFNSSAFVIPESWHATRRKLS